MKSLGRRCFLWSLCLVWGILGGGEVYAADWRMLFIGNSYTYGNDLELLSKEFFQRGNPAWKEVFVKRVAPGGYRWDQHLQDAQGTAETELRRYLVTDTDPLTMWDAVILQEQSQIPGFPQTDSYWKASLTALKGLHGLIQKRGSKTVLLMTWGRHSGDPQNASLYPNFKVMQSRLTAGYKAYAAQAGTTQAPILVAPVGQAFEKIYDDIVAAGKKPEDPGTLFTKLYASDGSHPSIHGSYLAACVLFATIANKSPVGVDWVPSAEISTQERDLLQAAAAAVAPTPSPGEEKRQESPNDGGNPTPEPSAEPRNEGSSRENAGPPEFPSDVADGAAPNVRDTASEAPTTQESNLPETSGTPSEQTAETNAPTQGCCAAQDGPASLWWLMLALVCVGLLRREERSSRVDPLLR